MRSDEPPVTAGLEIHQQLDTTTKLFCGCPTRLRDPSKATRIFHRYLHPTKSELGEIDEAALEESRIDRRFEYLAYDTTCLVEEDDEPPGRLNTEAVEIAMQIAAALDMTVVDQAHVMRKIVVDGSNTSGFQRTVELATDGVIETEHGSVAITDLMLEEESAQRVEELPDGVRYSLDRLGIPLVEVGTAPDITSPAEARAVAEQLGMVLRSTRAVKRGLGTIRQDVNISVPGGARVELKGVQALDDIDDIVRLEMRRQERLIDIAAELDERGASVDDPVEVTATFEGTDSPIVADAIGDGGAVYAAAFHGFEGLVGRELQPDRRLGSELADHARRHGVDGLFHSDELPAYGITEAEVEAVFDATDAGDGDAVAIVAGSTDHAELAIRAAADRAAVAIEGVPEETRDATPDATSRYLRPLPGAARMYPETDVPPVTLDPSEVEVPELLTETVDRFVETYELDPGLAEQVAFGRHTDLFETVLERFDVAPGLVAQTLEGTLTELRRDGVAVAVLEREHLLGMFELLEEGTITSDGIVGVLHEAAAHPDRSVESLAEQAGLTGIDEAAVRETVERVVEANAEQIEAEGMGAFSALMGECMASLRGRAEGELVSELLREAIQERTS